MAGALVGGVRRLLAALLSSSEGLDLLSRSQPATSALVHALDPAWQGSGPTLADGNYAPRYADSLFSL